MPDLASSRSSGPPIGCPNCDHPEALDLRQQAYAKWERQNGTKFTDRHWWLVMIGGPLSLLFVPTLLRTLPNDAPFVRFAVVSWCLLVVVIVAAELLTSIVVKWAPLQCPSCSTMWGPGERGVARALARRLVLAQALYFTGDRAGAVRQVEDVLRWARWYRADLAGSTDVWSATLILCAIFCVLTGTKEGQQRAHAALLEALPHAKLPTTISAATTTMSVVERGNQPSDSGSDWRAISQRMVETIVAPPDPPLVSTGWRLAGGTAIVALMLWLFGAFGSQKQAPVKWFYYEVTEIIWYQQHLDKRVQAFRDRVRQDFEARFDDRR